MGALQSASIKLRPYGTNQYLGLNGSLRARITCDKGASIDTEVYVVEGHLTEALLGDEDAKALGILRINPEGSTIAVESEEEVAGITSSLRNAGIQVETARAAKSELPQEERRRIDRIIQRYPEVLKNDEEAGDGLLQDETLQKPDVVQFHIDPRVPPTTARYKPPPVAYQERLSQHL